DALLDRLRQATRNPPKAHRRNRHCRQPENQAETVLVRKKHFDYTGRRDKLASSHQSLFGSSLYRSELYHGLRCLGEDIGGFLQKKIPVRNQITQTYNAELKRQPKLDRR